MNIKIYITLMIFILSFPIKALSSSGYKVYINFNDRRILPEHPAPIVDANKKILILGNSITLVKANPEIGWYGHYGMAASTKSKDYSHILIKKLGFKEKDSFIMNLYPLEIDTYDLEKKLNYIDKAVSNHTKYLVLQMGDNVGHGQSVYHFQKSMESILSKVSTYRNIKIACISSYWSIYKVDNLIKNICKKYGGIFVYIGDIYRFQNENYQKFGSPGIDAHPKDKQMEEIANRIHEAFIKNDSPFVLQSKYYIYRAFDLFKWSIISIITKFSYF